MGEERGKIIHRLRGKTQTYLSMREKASGESLYFGSRSLITMSGAYMRNEAMPSITLHEDIGE